MSDTTLAAKFRRQISHQWLEENADLAENDLSPSPIASEAPITGWIAKRDSVTHPSHGLLIAFAEGARTDDRRGLKREVRLVNCSPAPSIRPDLFCSVRISFLSGRIVAWQYREVNPSVKLRLACRSRPGGRSHIDSHNYASARQTSATNAQMAMPITTGNSAATVVHFALRVSFQIV